MSPHLVRGLAAVAQWSSDPAVNDMLLQYGTRHKKEKEFTETGETQEQLEEGPSLEQTTQLFNMLSPQAALDVSSISSRFTKFSFFFGFKNGTRNARVVNNGGLLVRVLFIGQLDIIACPLKPIADLLDDQTPPSMENIQTRMDQLNDDDVAKLETLGCKLWKCTLTAGDVMIIPQGWIMAQRAGGLLTYGVRKSFYMKHKESLEPYVKVIENDKSFQAGHLRKVKQVLALMEPDVV